jgi:CDP-paratose 2-epimerase
MFAHVFKRPLAFIGFGGKGQQVRDVLHVDDLADLIAAQLTARDTLAGEVFNAGGGLAHSASLAEFTEHCASVSGNRLDLQVRPETRPGDVPIYITDNAKVRARFGWSPSRSVGQLAADLCTWIRAHEAALRATLS